MGHSVITCDLCGASVMEGRNTWKCVCGAKYTPGTGKWIVEGKKVSNVVDLFAKETITEKRFLNYEKLNDHDIQKFLNVLDESVLTFCELSVMEKLSLYRTLVDFTKTSMGIYMKGDKV
jgi:hypothetical protein